MQAILSVFQNCLERSRNFNVSYFTISQKVTAHRFSPLGYPGGIEAAFPSKINTFLAAEKR